MKELAFPINVVNLSLFCVFTVFVSHAIDMKFRILFQTMKNIIQVATSLIMSEMRSIILL